MPLKDPVARKEYLKEYFKKKAQEDGSYHRNTHLLKRYGITADEYDRLNELQNGVCAICGNGPDKHQRYLHVDHNHLTGSIRGLLCGNCNRGIGLLQDDPEILQNASDYLRKYNGN